MNARIRRKKAKQLIAVIEAWPIHALPMTHAATDFGYALNSFRTVLDTLRNIARDTTEGSHGRLDARNE